MKTNTIRIIIFLTVIAVIAMVINQYFWVKTSVEIQEKTIRIQKKNAEMSRAQFDDKVTLALVGVRDKLISMNAEAFGLYLEPVQQVTENYYVVSFYDTLNPSVLQNLLLEKFAEYKITESFEYGIYDCFTDSIIFDKYVDLSKGEVIAKQSSAPQQKWNHDGHYFGVYFPDRQEVGVDQIQKISSSLGWSSLLIAVILLVFSITIFTILRQKRLSEVKTDFINNMTHELKTPISTIALSSEVLKNVDETTEVKRIKQYAAIIRTENARLESQVERVLQLAKLEKGKVQLKKEMIDLHQLINKCTDSFKLIIQAKNGELNFELNANRPKLYADKVHLSNVIYNLLDNSTKYCREIPEIIIRTYNDKNFIVLEVEDKGKGMSKDQISQIFEKFYRVPTGSVHDVKGFGLGLYYVKEIIKSHGGSISVKSEPDVGSTFTVKLPQN